MPNPTFFNLPDEKRTQILQVAIEEFANNDYDTVSISRIVARAGIAKGSFYQYFADKDDLYSHLFTLLAEAKTRFLALDTPDPQHTGIFAYLRWLAEMGFAFEVAHPQLSRIGYRALNSGIFPKAFNAQMREATQGFYRRLVEIGKEQGDIAPEIDPELAAFIFDSVMTSLSRFIFKLAAAANITLDDSAHSLFEVPQVKKAFADTISILERGMGVRCVPADAILPQQ